MVRCLLIHSLTPPTHNNNIPLQTVSVSPTFHSPFFITTSLFSFALVIGWVGAYYIYSIHTNKNSVIGPYAYWQQRLLTDVIALQQMQRALSNQIDRLINQNSRLHTSLQSLTTTVNRLEDVEWAYNVVTSTQSQTIEAFEEQVRNNRLVLSKMQSGLKSNILQYIYKVIIRSDTDGSFILDEDEINDLIDKFNRNSLVEFNEELFRHYITNSGGSIQSIMDIIRNLIHDKNDQEEVKAIFIIKDELQG